MSNPTYTPPPVTDADRVALSALLADLMSANAGAHAYGMTAAAGGALPPDPAGGGFLEAIADAILLARGVRAAGNLNSVATSISGLVWTDLGGLTFTFQAALAKTYTIMMWPRVYRPDTTSQGFLCFVTSPDGTTWTRQTAVVADFAPALPASVPIIVPMLLQMTFPKGTNYVKLQMEGGTMADTVGQFAGSIVPYLVLA